MNFALNMMNCVLNMMNFVLKRDINTSIAEHLQHHGAVRIMY